MALIVEDGSIVANANTYASDSAYTAYASQRGITIGADATAREAELINAMDYIESHRDKFKGYKVSQNQSLQWPRQGVYIDQYLFASDAIPQELINAQIEAAIAVSSGTSIKKTGDYQNVQSESIGDLSVSYFSGGSFQGLQLDGVNFYLKSLLKAVCGRLVRV